jgi:hypothetical protein
MILALNVPTVAVEPIVNFIVADITVLGFIVDKDGVNTNVRYVIDLIGEYPLICIDNVSGMLPVFLM